MGCLPDYLALVATGQLHGAVKQLTAGSVLIARKERLTMLCCLPCQMGSLTEQALSFYLGTPWTLTSYPSSLSLPNRLSACRRLLNVRITDPAPSLQRKSILSRTRTARLPACIPTAFHSPTMVLFRQAFAYLSDGQVTPSC